MNKKIILTSLIVLGTTLFSHSAFSYENVISDYVKINKDRTYNGDTKIADYFETIDATVTINGNLEIGSFADIDGDLIVNGDLHAKDYLDIDGNLIVSGDIIIDDYLEIDNKIKGKSIDIGMYADLSEVYSEGVFEAEDYLTVTDGMFVGGNFISKDYLELDGKSKILGDFETGSFADVNDTTYIYGLLYSEDYFTFLNKKLKVLSTFDTKDFSDISGRLYIYGEKTYGSYYEEEYNNYGGIMGEIDPLLIYSLSKTEINSIKNRIASDYEKVKNLEHTQNAYSTMKSLYSFLKTKVEKEAWDQNKFNALQERELKKFKYHTPSTPKVIVEKESTTPSKYNPTLPAVLEKKLDSIIAKLSTKQKAVVYSKLIDRIDEIVTKLETKTLTEKAIKKINILLGIKEYMERKINAFEEYEDIIKELGL